MPFPSFVLTTKYTNTFWYAISLKGHSHAFGQFFSQVFKFYNASVVINQNLNLIVIRRFISSDHIFDYILKVDKKILGFDLE